MQGFHRLDFINSRNENVQGDTAPRRKSRPVPAVIFEIQHRIRVDDRYADCHHSLACNAHGNVRDSKIWTSVQHSETKNTVCATTALTDQDQEYQEQESVDIVELVVPEAAEHEVHLNKN